MLHEKPQYGLSFSEATIILLHTFDFVLSFTLSPTDKNSLITQSAALLNEVNSIFTLPLTAHIRLFSLGSFAPL